MVKLIALMCVIGVAFAFGVAATAGRVDSNPVRFVQQALGDENEADENESDSGENETDENEPNSGENETDERDNEADAESAGENENENENDNGD